MIGLHLVASLEEIIVDRLGSAIVPCNVYAIPSAVVHLHIIPHMRFIVGACCSAHKRTGNAESVAEYFQGF